MIKANDAKLTSWVEVPAGSDFPIQNLPFGIFKTKYLTPVAGVAIGNYVLDLVYLHENGYFDGLGLPVGIFNQKYLNDFISLGRKKAREVRARVSELLQSENDELQSNRAAREIALVPMSEVQMQLPVRIGNYTDFYSSEEHATNVGTMFRGAENALPPNWLHIPIGYNGRASSVVVSGTEVRRPWGQVKSPDHEMPAFQPSRRFDIELEMGAVVGQASRHGYPVTVAEADAMIFGYVLLNDWSARDIQAWEYQPLGPFQAKATATTISPWVVMTAALEPFRTSTPARDKPLLPYLAEPKPMLYNIALEVGLTPEGGEETILARTNYAEMYYSAPQQLAHHTTSGCAMNVGDLLGSGTISGPTKDSRGSLLELSWGGKEPIAIKGGTRTFIEDNDTLTLRGAAQGDGYRIGFGECAGKVTPALANPYERN